MRSAHLNSTETQDSLEDSLVKNIIELCRRCILCSGVPVALRMWEDGGWRIQQYCGGVVDCGAQSGNHGIFTSLSEATSEWIDYFD